VGKQRLIYFISGMMSFKGICLWHSKYWRHSL